MDNKTSAIWSIERGSIVQVVSCNDESYKGAVVGLDYWNNILCLSCCPNPSDNIDVLKIIKLSHCKYVGVLSREKSNMLMRCGLANGLFVELTNRFGMEEVIWERDSIIVKHIARIEQPFLDVNVVSLSTPNGRKKVSRLRRVVRQFHDMFNRKVQQQRDLDTQFVLKNNAMDFKKVLEDIGDEIKNEQKYAEVPPESVVSPFETQMNEDLTNLCDITAHELAEINDKYYTYGIRDKAKSACSIKQMVPNQELWSYRDKEISRNNSEIMPNIPKLNKKKHVQFEETTRNIGSFVSLSDPKNRSVDKPSATLPNLKKTADPNMNKVYGCVGKRIDNTPPKAYMLRQQHMAEQKETTKCKRSAMITRAATTGEATLKFSPNKKISTAKSNSIPIIVKSAKTLSKTPE